MAKKRFVVCIDNSDFAVSLEVRKIYEVVPDATAMDVDQIRVLDESGESYLYPSSRFIEISLSEPAIAALYSAA
jgi:hypothetical protein